MSIENDEEQNEVCEEDFLNELIAMVFTVDNIEYRYSQSRFFKMNNWDFNLYCENTDGS